MTRRFLFSFLLAALHLSVLARPSVRVDAFEMRSASAALPAAAQLFRAHLLEALCDADVADFSDAGSREAAVRERNLIRAGMTARDEGELKRFRPASSSLYGSVLRADLRRESQHLVATVEVQVRLTSMTSGKILAAHTVEGRAESVSGRPDRLLERALKDAAAQASRLIADRLRHLAAAE